MKTKHIAFLIVGVFFLFPVVGNAAINLHWDNADTNIVKTDIYRTVTGNLSDPDSRYFIASVYTPTTSFRDTGVNKGVKYFYTLFNFDDNGVMSDPGSVYFTDDDGMIENEQPVEEKPEPPRRDGKARTTARLNVRDNPSLAGRILRVQDAGSTGTIEGTSTYSGGREWVKVIFDNAVTGWVAKEFISEETTEVTTPVLSDAERTAKIRQIQILLAELMTKLITLLQQQGR